MIEGIENDRNHSYISLEIYKCSDHTKRNQTKECATYDEIDDYLRYKKLVPKIMNNKNDFDCPDM